jgi:hypothetical protein
MKLAVMDGSEEPRDGLIALYSLHGCRIRVKVLVLKCGRVGPQPIRF